MRTVTDRFPLMSVLSLHRHLQDFWWFLQTIYGNLSAMAPCNALLSSVVSILGSYGGPLWKGNYAHLLGGFNTENIWNYWMHLYTWHNIYIYNDITIWIHMILLAYIRWTTQKKYDNMISPPSLFQSTHRILELSWPTPWVWSPQPAHHPKWTHSPIVATAWKPHTQLSRSWQSGRFIFSGVMMNHGLNVSR